MVTSAKYFHCPVLEMHLFLKQAVHSHATISIPPRLPCLFHFSFSVSEMTCFQQFLEMKPHQSLCSLIRMRQGGKRDEIEVKIYLSLGLHSSTASNAPNYQTEKQVPRWQFTPPLTLHLATNRGDFRLCYCWAAEADPICKDWHPDDDCGGCILPCTGFHLELLRNRAWLWHLLLCWELLRYISHSQNLCWDPGRKYHICPGAFLCFCLSVYISICIVCFHFL